jgi:ribonuclease T
VTDETWISVDVEASGPTPSTGSLLSIGACVVHDPQRAFYVEMRPLPDRPWSVQAQRVHRLTRAHLNAHALEVGEATRAFVDWVEAEAAGRRAVFVGFNAPFDWMWIADHAWQHAGRNPFGSSALDLKALYLGMHLPEVSSWRETSLAHVTGRYPPGLPHTHGALDDAREQAAICRLLLAARGAEPPGA